jgi:rod shape-determining protein MreD
LLAGVTLGLIHDGMTAVYPSHILSLVLVGVLTASLRRQLYLQENLISVVLIVFFMVIVAETAIAIQYSLMYLRPLKEIWQDYLRIAIASATLSSLWAPALYYPLNQWWAKLRKLEK